MLKLLLKDPIFGLRCFFGACAPYQYRIMGPGAWDGAKKALEDLPENVIFPTKTRVVPREKRNSLMLFVYVAIAVTFLAFLLRIFSVAI